MASAVRSAAHLILPSHPGSKYLCRGNLAIAVSGAR